MSDMSEYVEVKIRKPTKSDWKEMSDEYGWGENEFRWSSPIGDYVVGKREGKNGEAWWFSPNKLYKYSQNGKEYSSKDEACKAAFNDYIGKINNA